MSALSKSRSVSVRKDEGKRLEEETRRMEAKLEALRRTMDTAAAESAASRNPGVSEGTRWRSGASSRPIRGYAKGVLEPQRPAKGGSDKDTTRPPARPSSVGDGYAPQSQPRAAAPPGDGHVSELLLTSARQERSPSDGGGAGGSAASNLRAALQQQDEDSQGVAQFLASLKLDRYITIFCENGFDCMDVVQDMQECHMREIGMAAGHILKLKKRLAELRQAASPQAEPAAPAASSASSTTRGGEEQRKVSFRGAETVLVHTDGAAASPTRAPTSAASGSALAEGAFDEAESAASFQEALRAWREGRAVADAPAAAKQAAAPAAPSKPGSFWSSMGESEVNLVRCSTPVKAPTEESSGVDTETQGNLAPSEEKICCYSCLKQFYKRFAVERSVPEEMSSTVACGLQGRNLGAAGKRLLCSEACADRWVAATQEKIAAQRRRQDKLEALREVQRAIEVAEASSAEAPAVVAAAA
mmetsp:Transcript_91945/g.265263  ORF Transcript_91945/g.265263 Transcript_91945/m.265263 type:complete len:473 (-) Transcript_91945:121-1539(-)